MQKYKIPSMGALLAFEAAARYQSFTLAAKELFVTESAISRQVNSLEADLGVRLFVRVKQRVVLTRAGKLYSMQVRHTIDGLNRDTISIIAHGTGGGHLELAVLPTFASEWLIPRMGGFNEAYPELRVNMSARTHPFVFNETHFEAAIHYGRPSWPGAFTDYLFGEEVVPVCSRKLVPQQIASPIDLLRYPLLHSTTRPDDWSNWFQQAHVESDNRTMKGTRYELHTMLLSAAAASLGIALVPRFFVLGKLAHLGLVIPYDAPMRMDEAYYLIYPSEFRHAATLENFREWLLGQAKNYATEDGSHSAHGCGSDRSRD